MKYFINRKLVSLKLYSVGDEEFDTIIEFGSNLKELYVELYDIQLVEDYEFWLDLAKLTKLRSLTICAYSYDDDGKMVVKDTKLNVDGLILVLKLVPNSDIFNSWAIQLPKTL